VKQHVTLDKNANEVGNIHNPILLSSSTVYVIQNYQILRKIHQGKEATWQQKAFYMVLTV